MRYTDYKVCYKVYKLLQTFWDFVDVEKPYGIRVFPVFATKSTMFTNRPIKLGGN